MGRKTGACPPQRSGAGEKEEPTAGREGGVGCSFEFVELDIQETADCCVEGRWHFLSLVGQARAALCIFPSLSPLSLDDVEWVREG